MAIDLNRVIQAAAEAMLDGGGSGSKGNKEAQKGKKNGFSMPRAFLIGAGAVTAGRLVAGSRGRDLLENLQQRLVEYEHEHFESEDGEEPYADDEPDAEAEEEPEAEEDEDFDEDEAGEPEAEDDEDFDEDEAEEPEAEDDEPERPRRRRVRSGSGAAARRNRG
ncbi:MAG TPA: hypothetical protein VKR21_12310 [Solirubrobacteraceae bacterium]|nr:hypothetical protein [Solirubrobacteraceae bacterium]